MDDDKLAALWARVPKRELPMPACTYADHSYPAYNKHQMRAAMVPTPEALRAFAEAVAEECAMLVVRMFSEDGRVSKADAAAAIRRHVKGDR